MTCLFRQCSIVTGVRTRKADFIPVIVRKLSARVPPLDASTVDKNLDLVAIFQDGRCDGFNGFLRGEVGGIDGGFTTEGFNCVFCCWVREIALRSR